jgi:NitT/TauT family transport system permease protein
MISDRAAAVVKPGRRTWFQPGHMPWAPSLESLRFADIGLGLGVLALLYIVARVGSESLVKFSPPDVIPTISLDPRNLPNYAARSTLCMFLALAASTLFTFVYGYAPLAAGVPNVF